MSPAPCARGRGGTGGRHASSRIKSPGRATEAALKDLSDSGRLADYAILHFATHGALSGQVQGAAEPGLS